MLMIYQVNNLFRRSVTGRREERSPQEYGSLFFQVITAGRFWVIRGGPTDLHSGNVFFQSPIRND